MILNFQETLLLKKFKTKFMEIEREFDPGSG